MMSLNYAADAVFGGTGDVAFLLQAYPRCGVHFAAWLLTLLAAEGAFGGIWKATQEHGVSTSVSV